jgi:predicted cation transporter
MVPNSRSKYLNLNSKGFLIIYRFTLLSSGISTIVMITIVIDIISYYLMNKKKKIED